MKVSRDQLNDLVTSNLHSIVLSVWNCVDEQKYNELCADCMCVYMSFFKYGF